ncbi:structural maintenance of chromosome protein [Heterostelium album PN500]|uniref:Structural maintenance of chromosome protein n=1 Tax=Heterostelium pallidum (strain ATCC 26659 / Pp 5 / PN500) TaxID=670386 RepID=D3B5U7_HETP5|nr:structural maintenance of chromosome protein [Heterostelium album PN500]EFA83245.1 structural maintenance of chromosome protein [Heterostelium album PN500]|eukprot:XP_020435362.1 structural maintenance of chromosome protein [Heterostelium album PN500]
MVVGKRKQEEEFEEELADNTKNLKRQRKPVNNIQIVQSDDDEEIEESGDDSSDGDDDDSSSGGDSDMSDIEQSQPISPIAKGKGRRAAVANGHAAKTNGNGNGNGNGVNHHNNKNNNNNNNNIQQNGNAPMSRRNITEDGNEEEEDELSEDEEEVARSLHESELGIIEKITLENFMCHKHFEIVLGPNVNFISGENGSGKSALLVALMVCLGAKAGTTNRGHKLADLVKTDSQGNEAYRHKEFGDSIIIERKIYKSGTSGGYKIKDATGKKTISTKHDDILLILEQFNIQIDNPMAILMQDTSREFLNESTPQAKYNLFLTATQLDQMKKDFNFIDDNIKEINSILEKKNYIIDEMEKKVAEYTKEYKELQKVFNLETSVQELKEKLAWSYVVEIERSIATLTSELEACDKGASDSQQRVDELQQSITNVTQEIVRLRAENAALVESTRTFDDRRQANQLQLNEIHKEEAKGDLSRVYGDKMPALLKKIRDNQRRFTGKTPIGPIGMNIKVRQEKWAYAIESCITKKSLRGFIVETFADGDLLSAFAKDLGIPDFEVTCVQKFQDRVYREIRDDFDPKYLTVLRAIESDTPHVLNFLIDTKKIHTTLLEEDRHKAEYIIYQERPAFLKDAYTLIGDKIYMKGNTQGITTDTIVEVTDDPTEEWERGIQQMDIEFNEYRESIKQQDEEKALIIAKRLPILASNKELDAEVGKINRQINAADQKIGALAKQERELRQNEGKLLMTSTKHSTQRATIAQQLEAQKQSLIQQQEKAEQFCGRVEVLEKETPDHLTRDINKHKAAIERETKGRRSRAEVINSLRDTQASLHEATDKRDTLKKLCQSAKVRLDDRFQNWQKFRTKISRRTALFFNIFLSRKGYSGNIQFDHTQKRLEVNVQLNKMAPANQQSSAIQAAKGQAKGKGDTKTLSGGERSFSTVSLLLSLWEAMECPFRAMDEFDVFMDEVNRRISIDLLLSKAKENRNRQYIFVTPLPLNSITPSPHIFIHKVRPPF